MSEHVAGPEAPQEVLSKSERTKEGTLKSLRVVLFVCLAALIAAPASASDFSFGTTARSIGMGGAGLALADNPGNTVVLNPAAPAASGQRIRFIFPGLEFHSSGASFSDLADSIDKISSGNADDALDLVNDFATRETTLTFHTVTGIAGPFGVTVAGDAQAVITPGAAAAEWAGAAMMFESGNVNLSAVQSQISNANFQAAMTAAASGDLTTANTAFNAYLNDLSQNFIDGSFVYGPGVALSHGFNTKSGGKLWLGANVNLLKSEAHRWQVTAAAPGGLTVSGGAISADMNFDAVEQQVISRSSVKADVGLIYRPKNSMLQYGMVVENLIEPDLDGIRNSKADRSVSVGMAIVPTKNFLWAVDLINLNGANGQEKQLRMGGELRLGKFAAVRAGYSSRTWTYGVEVLGLNLAWAGKSAQLLSNVLKF